MIKYILWDFDGVIAESVNVKTEAFYDMYLPHGKAIAEKVVEHHMANGGISRFEKFRHCHKTLLGIDLTQAEIDKLANDFSELVLKKVVAAPYIAGVMEFIRGTQGKYKHYVISGTPDGEMKEIVQQRKIAGEFLRIMGSPNTKSFWIKSLVNEGLITANESLFVGDATTDFNAAKECGTKFVLRETDYNKDIFSSYKGPRVQDFIQFTKVVESL